MIAAAAQAEAEVPPIPFGRDALQTGIIGDQMDQDVIQMLVEELGNGGPLRMTAQKHQRRFGLFLARRIDHGMDQRHQSGPHLFPDGCGHVTGRSRSCLGGRLR